MQFEQFQFTISTDVQALGVKAVCFVMEQAHNAKTCSEFEPLKAHTHIVGDLSSELMASDPTLLGFRQLHDAIAPSNRTNIASPESLPKLVFKVGCRPQVNLLVDIYTLVFVKTWLPLGAHDLTTINGNVQLRLTDGTENFWPMGSDKTKF